MGHAFGGQNGTEFSLPYNDIAVIFSILDQYLGEKTDVIANPYVPERECKKWASLLRNNVDRMRLVFIRGTKYGYIEGTDLRHLLKEGYYAWLKFTPSEIEKAVSEPLNDYWIETITEFADFLDSCGGLVPPKPAA
jgi:hypothetical protein